MIIYSNTIVVQDYVNNDVDDSIEHGKLMGLLIKCSQFLMSNDNAGK